METPEPYYVKPSRTNAEVPNPARVFLAAAAVPGLVVCRNRCEHLIRPPVANVCDCCGRRGESPVSELSVQLNSAADYAGALIWRYRLCDNCRYGE